MSQIDAGDLHQLTFRSYPFEEEDQLQLEEDDRIDGGTPVRGITLLNPLTHEGEIKFTLEMAIEVLSGNELLK